MNRVSRIFRAVVQLYRREPALCNALAVAVVGAGSPLLTVGTTEHGILLALLNVIVALSGGAATRGSVWTKGTVAKLVTQALVANVRTRAAGSSTTPEPRPSVVP